MELGNVFVVVTMGLGSSFQSEGVQTRGAMQGDYRTSLMWAALNVHVDSVNALIEEGANIEAGCKVLAMIRCGISQAVIAYMLGVPVWRYIC